MRTSLWPDLTVRRHTLQLPITTVEHIDSGPSEPETEPDPLIFFVLSFYTPDGNRHALLIESDDGLRLPTWRQETGMPLCILAEAALREDLNIVPTWLYDSAEGDVLVEQRDNNATVVHMAAMGPLLPSVEDSIPHKAVWVAWSDVVNLKGLPQLY